jgi:hypothetical protein
MPKTINEGEWTGWTVKEVQEVIDAPCDLRRQEPFDFAWCETHDETFALGNTCHFKEETTQWLIEKGYLNGSK